MTETILLDMDGVVLEGPGTPQSVYDRAADTAVDELGLEPTDRQRADLRSHGYESVESACAALGTDPREFWRRKEEAASRLAVERIRSGERALYDDVATLESLAERATLALVSNNRHETAAFVADRLSAPFAAARGREPTPEGFRRRKPDPHLLEETLAELGVETGAVRRRPRDRRRRRRARGPRGRLPQTVPQRRRSASRGCDRRTRGVR